MKNVLDADVVLVVCLVDEMVRVDRHIVSDDANVRTAVVRKFIGLR